MNAATQRWRAMPVRFRPDAVHRPGRPSGNIGVAPAAPKTRLNQKNCARLRPVAPGCTRKRRSQPAPQGETDRE